MAHVSIEPIKYCKYVIGGIMSDYSDLFVEFIEDWNKTHSEKMKAMGATTAVAEGNDELWVAEDRVFEVEVNHYVLDGSDIYTDD